MPSSSPSRKHPLDITPHHLAIIEDILKHNVPDNPIWAFGSRVSGHATSTSDLDLAIISTTPLDFLLLANLKDAFSTSFIPYKIDIVDWASITPEFQRNIQKEYRVLQEGKRQEKA